MSEFAAPRKSLGQNFLQDQNIIRKIVAGLNVQDGDVVVEIGPGRGALTEHLLQRAAQLHLIEFDRDLAAHWRQQAQQNAKLTVHESDVLAFNFASIEHPEKIKVIGNLPYNISSPVLFHLMKVAEQIESQVVMLQKEVIQRICAVSGNKQYGRLSVMMQYRYQVENLFTVPPTAFYPAPKVDSAVARLTPKPIEQCLANNINDLERVVKTAFSQRRKTLRNTLKPIFNAEQIETVGIDPSARAETLSVDQYVDLSNLLSADN